MCVRVTSLWCERVISFPPAHQTSGRGGKVKWSNGECEANISITLLEYDNMCHTIANMTSYMRSCEHLWKPFSTLSELLDRVTRTTSRITKVWASSLIKVPISVQLGGKVHGPRRMLQKDFKSNFDPFSCGIDPN